MGQTPVVPDIDIEQSPPADPGGGAITLPPTDDDELVPL